MVVTIIVLLILAGISISAINSDNGIIDKAVDARDNWNDADRKEQNKLNEVIEMNKR